MNTKLVNHKPKDDVSVVMDPYDRYVFQGMITKWIHMFYQQLVRDDPGLFETLHAPLNAHVDQPLVVNQCGEVLSINYFLCDRFQGNAHKFRFW